MSDSIDINWERRKAENPKIVDDIYADFMAEVEICDAHQAAPTNAFTAEERDQMQADMMRFKQAFVKALEENLRSHGIFVRRFGIRGFTSDHPHFLAQLGDREGRTYEMVLMLDEANELLTIHGPSGGQRLLELAIKRILEARARRFEKEAAYLIRAQ